jgi:hypothetical protein
MRGAPRVKAMFAACPLPTVRAHASASARRIGGPSLRGGFPMADLAYVVLLIGSFALLALMLRGLESL